MEKGIQLNDKVGNVLINVYEPDASRSAEAVELLFSLKSLISARMPEQTPNVAPAPSYAAKQPTRRDWSQPKGDQSVKWCTKGHETGAHDMPVQMKWVQFKEPRPSKFNPEKMETGFFSCDACYAVKKGQPTTYAPTYAQPAPMAPSAPPVPQQTQAALAPNPGATRPTQPDVGLDPHPDEIAAALEDIPF